MSWFAALRRLSIARRLAGFAVLFVSASVIVASLILYQIVAGVARDQIDQRLDTQIEGLRGALTTNADGAVILSAVLDGPPFDRRGSGWYWQVSGADMHLTSRSLANATIDSPPAPLDWRQMFDGGPQRGERGSFRNESLHIRTAMASVGGRSLTILVSAPEAALREPARRALFWLVPAMTALGAVLIAGILLQVRYGLRPLRQLTADIAAIGAGTLPRLPDSPVEELRPVSGEINRLVDQNAERLTETRLHFANLAHGLKTPVTSLALALEDTNDPDGTLRTLVGRIDQRIRHHLARARKTAAGSGITTRLRPRVEDVVLVLSRIHAERGIAVDLAIDEPDAVACAPEDLEEILGNLIDNAFKWTRSRVAITARPEGNRLALTIADDGPGIAPDRMAEVFRPGTRMDESVPGDGFGLSIANELVQLYGGTITLSSAAGGGLVQTVTLPRAIA